MIALDSSSAHREALSEQLPAMEIYEGLLRYRGRTVRIQESSVEKLENPPARRGGEPTRYESRSYSDQLGTLSGLKLGYFDYFYPDGEKPSGDLVSFDLLLDGETLKRLRLNRARIQVLQEDSGSWELIFQGSAWTDFDRNYLRIYS